MIEDGIIDSFNTLKTAIEDAVSVASLLITTECIVFKECDYERNNIDQILILKLKLPHLMLLETE